MKELIDGRLIQSGNEACTQGCWERFISNALQMKGEVWRGRTEQQRDDGVGGLPGGEHVSGARKCLVRWNGAEGGQFFQWQRLLHLQKDLSLLKGVGLPGFSDECPQFQRAYFGGNFQSIRRRIGGEDDRLLHAWNSASVQFYQKLETRPGLVMGEG